MDRFTQRITYLMRGPGRFAQAGDIRLRPYQEIAIRAVVNSVRHRRGMRFVWIFPRQSGKDEGLAILVQYLMTLFQSEGGELVFFNPTFKPQTETSMRRLETRLNHNCLTMGKWSRRSGYIYKMGECYCTYLSADPTAHVVSATANRLLIVNEAQDVGLMKYDKDIDPMAASTKATILFAGTRWTEKTLLEREYKMALEKEKEDRLRRVFFFTEEEVRKSVPEYGEHVDEAVRRLGRQHPLVKTQFFCELVEEAGGMFPPGRQALMHGSHVLLTEPEAGKVYAFLIDVAGQDEEKMAGFENEEKGGKSFLPYTGKTKQERDSTHVKIVEIDMSTMQTAGKPTYLVRFRKEWTGSNHVELFGALRTLVDGWKPLKIVMDATGVGEGLWGMMENAYGEERVMGVKFTAKLKSELGYGFIGIIESGRYREYSPFPDKLQVQLDKCKSEVVGGPTKSMRWGVPDGTSGPNGEAVHDDDLITGAMCTLLERMEWYVPTEPLIVRGKDPLEDMDHFF